MLPWEARTSEASGVQVCIYIYRGWGTGIRTQTLRPGLGTEGSEG